MAAPYAKICILCQDELDSEGAPNVIEDVQHPEEEVATRNDELLREQGDHDWADSVSEIIRSDTVTIDEGAEGEEVFLYPFMRAPKEFKAALLEGPDLYPVREKMREAGLEHILQPSGAKIFVCPWQYAPVIETLDKMQIELHASHVIIAQSLLPCLEASIATISSKRNVRVKSEGIMHVASISAPVQSTDGGDMGEEEVKVNEDSDIECMEHLFNVERLPLGRVVVRFLINPSSVNQSTTEAHSRSVNPRRYV
jgi:hypothetical protein